MDAAVDSGQPIGRLTLSHLAYAAGACSYSIDWSYDSLGRPLSSQASIAPGNASTCPVPETVAFSAWDLSGRPTTGTYFNPRIGCTATTTRAYDDANHSITFTNSGCTSGSARLAPNTTVDTYNSDGIAVSATVVSPMGQTLETVTYAILATSQICR
jgi:hypothetical protein